jgi:hypothetical protein
VPIAAATSRLSRCKAILRRATPSATPANANRVATAGYFDWHPVLDRRHGSKRVFLFPIQVSPAAALVDHRQSCHRTQSSVSFVIGQARRFRFYEVDKMADTYFNNRTFDPGDMQKPQKGLWMRFRYANLWQFAAQ